MIISASRRTDIPAFYSEWFIRRVRAGYCTVPNPYNNNQVTWVSLKPEKTEMIVFWTRNPRPLFPYLEELAQRGLEFYFHFTLMNNPREIDPKSPSLQASLETFSELAERIGSDKIIWRYDPIVLSTLTTTDFHKKQFGEIASALQQKTNRVVISIADVSSKIKQRMKDLQKQGIHLTAPDSLPEGDFAGLMRYFAQTARESGMEIVSCSEEIDLTIYDIRPGKCVDDDFIRKVFGKEVINKKDPSQRRACGCVVSKDIGMYDTCQFGCQYCYATSSFERAKQNYKEHDPNSPSLIGWFDADEQIQIPQPRLW